MNRRSRSRGVTPIAAALAVLVLGASASGLWWAQSAGTAHEADDTSRANAAQIQTAAKSFRAQHSDGCPTLSSLKEELLLSRNVREDDAWGNRFRVRCDADQLVVSSAGPDGKMNTPDDIRVAH